MNNPLEEISKVAHQLPLPVLQDINQRILASGGNDDDPYIEQQLRYANRFVKDDNK